MGSTVEPRQWFVQALHSTESALGVKRLFGQPRSLLVARISWYARRYFVSFANLELTELN